ncbi:hypothetical protein PP2015_3931 [Pseudoalteromonas phenolica]|uniref:SnoaL-like domain-containing protein n=2 Tax=Pseudoalteromonas phenolica TaxID=161398 RepID=A0A0S2K8U4_9GAMM|nr:hypothetical protein PP2015_3931 [Pseudoalteromonas phenolica]MBE0357411.1 hypothetical protein [Pseudoalteromonas phenolica O-BC30]
MVHEVTLSVYWVLMRVFSFVVLFVLAFAIQANPAFEEKTTELNSVKTEQEKAAEKVIDELIVAYNQQNIKSFLALYADDVEFYMYPQKLMFTGKEDLIKRYGLMFKKMKCLNAKSLKRIVHGNIVIDHESSEICSQQEGVIDKRSEFVTSYQIEKGKIKKVVFFR